MNKPSDSGPTHSLFASHGRSFQSHRYVYPVLSRRAGGISIGVNLNRDKACNFDCIYCQVDRTRPGQKDFLEAPRLVAELDHTIDLVTSGGIFRETRFRDTPESLRRLNDVALSGDGEPTMHPDFEQVVAACAEVRQRRCLEDVKLVLISNASLFHRKRILRALEILDGANGEIWAKLDAGTESYFRRVARTGVPFSRILENLQQTARLRPIVIQSLFMRIQGSPPPREEQMAYCDRLGEIVDCGGKIKLVQVHTVARTPAESWVAALSDTELDSVAELVRHRTGLPVATYYG